MGRLPACRRSPEEFMPLGRGKRPRSSLERQVIRAEYNTTVSDFLFVCNEVRLHKGGAPLTLVEVFEIVTGVMGYKKENKCRSTSQKMISQETQ